MTTKPPSSKGYLTKLTPNLQLIRQLIVERDLDFLIPVVGRERVGKSSLALQMAMVVDPEFKVDQVVFDVPQLYKKVYELKKGQCVIIDEGATAFFSRDALNEDVKDGIKLLTVMGERNLFVIICVPSFRLLDKYIREHRSSGIIRVTARGKFKFYTRRQVKMISANDKHGNIAWGHAKFEDSFGKMKGSLWDEYCKAKSAYLEKRKGKYAEGEENEMDNWFRPTEVARRLGKSKQAIYHMLKKKQIPGVKKDAFGKPLIPYQWVAEHEIKAAVSHE